MFLSPSRSSSLELHGLLLQPIYMSVCDTFASSPDDNVQQSARSTQQGVLAKLLGIQLRVPTDPLQKHATLSTLTVVTVDFTDSQNPVSDYLCKILVQATLTTSIISPSVSRPVPACCRATFATFLFAATSYRLDLTQDWSPRSGRTGNFVLA